MKDIDEEITMVVPISKFPNIYCINDASDLDANDNMINFKALRWLSINITIIVFSLGFEHTKF